VNSQTFCIIPWAHTRISADGTFTPCCKIDKSFPSTNISSLTNFDDWWNNDSMQNLRQDLSQGVKNEYCNVCWSDEAAGKSSLRQDFNKRLSKHTDLRSISKSQTFLAQNLPVGFDIDLGNICNFKCATCGPANSSKWQTERKQHASKFNALEFVKQLPDYDFDWPNQNNFQSWFQTVAPGMKLLSLRGGEPLLIKNVKSVINSVQDKQNCVINIVTNGSVDIDNDFLDDLKQFNEIWLSVSVDGIDGQGEYVRYGSNWSIIDKNIQKLSKLPNCTFRLNTVLQFFSSLTFPAIAEYALKNNLIVDILFCYQPKFYSIHAMQPQHQEKFYNFILDKISQHPEVKWLQDVKGFLESYVFDPVLHQQAKEYTDTLDSIRKNKSTSIQELFQNV
jgi:MoaA/NifB/PqqE/SkfB family radical SAM enzyme